MVMLFTEEQRALIKKHDEAWAEIYRRYPNASPEQRRALFLERYPEVPADFPYPARVPSIKHPDHEGHRRHVRMPDTWDEDLYRMLHTDEYALANIFKPFVGFQHQLRPEMIPDMRAAQHTLGRLVIELRVAVNTPEAHDFADLVDIFIEFIDETVDMLENYGVAYIERDSAL